MAGNRGVDRQRVQGSLDNGRSAQPLGPNSVGACDENTEVQLSQ